MFAIKLIIIFFCISFELVNFAISFLLFSIVSFNTVFNIVLTLDIILLECKFILFFTNPIYNEFSALLFILFTFICKYEYS